MRSRQGPVLGACAREVDGALGRYLPRAAGGRAKLASAMRYAVFSGGKRVRPFLVMEGARIAGGNGRSALPLACAIEMIHTYSLVHDDLPEMDNADVRRGRKSCHKKFGSAMAVLAGDALLTLAFEVIARGSREVPQSRVTRVLRRVAEAVGAGGMVSGQAQDLESVHRPVGAGAMERINELKTGRLIACSVAAGASWAGAPERLVRRFERFGKTIGSLYQVIDDIIDRQGYARLVGEKKAYEKAAQLKAKALGELKGLGLRARLLEKFVHYLYDRKT